MRGRCPAFLVAAFALDACSFGAPFNASMDAHDGAADVAPTPVYDLDLLFVVSNGNSMRDNQHQLLSQLGSMYQQLFASPLRTLQVGVISTDLGTPGWSVPGCVSPNGDDGMLNPIRYGAALSMHEPWTPESFVWGRPADCTDENEYPSFLAFDSSSSATTATHDISCNVALYVNGCGFRQPLEAVQRALIDHDATNRPGNTSPNAGFVRENALLAILVLDDLDDESVRDCTHADGSPCQDATDVFNSASTAWASTALRLRFFLDQPGSAQDPTWSLDRYVNAASPAAGWLALKPGHPERIVFGAITGVPLPDDGSGTSWQNADGTTNWNMLLGAVGGANADDFVHRDATQAIHAMSAEGSVSMQLMLDSNCSNRTVPACYRQASMNMPTYCTTDQQYYAWPSRRIVEVARRFDESALCQGAPCRNGFVASICASDYGTAVHDFAAKVVGRIGAN